MSDPVFVFGSNLSGIHGKGAAEYAYAHKGAVWGQGEGYQGNSYAIPTKSHASALTGRFKTLSLPEINEHVESFLQFARDRSDLLFQLTPIGCGLGRYTFEAIAPMFADAPSNVIIPWQFQQVLGGQ